MTTPTIIVYILVVIFLFIFIKNKKRELRYKYHEIPKAFEKSSLFKEVYTGAIEINGTITAKFNNYTMYFKIIDGKFLNISLKAYAENRRQVNIIWEPITVSDHTIQHIATNLINQSTNVNSDDVDPPFRSC